MCAEGGEGGGGLSALGTRQAQRRTSRISSASLVICIAVIIVVCIAVIICGGNHDAR